MAFVVNRHCSRYQHVAREDCHIEPSGGNERYIAKRFVRPPEIEAEESKRSKTYETEHWSDYSTILRDEKDR